VLRVTFAGLLLAGLLAAVLVAGLLIVVVAIWCFLPLSD
jgi:hypothetical protein